MRVVKSVLGLALAAILTACATPGPRPAVPPPAATASAASGTTILISIDGFRADYIKRGFTPTLAALAADGATTPAMRPSFPSLTFPNHYTLVTGLRPDEHGIVNNTIEDPARAEPVFTLRNKAAVTDAGWWNEATPIWVSAERQGVRTATMFWPGSEAAIQGVRPSYWAAFDQGMSSDDRVDTLLGWFDKPAAERPHLATLYFDIVDTAGHHYGPDSQEVNEAAAKVDAAVARLIAGLKARGLYEATNLVIVADHGMAATAAARTIVLDDIVGPDAARVVTTGAVAGLVPLAGHEAEAERALLAPHDHLTCWRKADIPARLHYGRNPRVPPIVCLAETGWMATTRERLAKRNSDPDHPAQEMKGEHGFDPYDPRLAALFVAHGPGIRPGVVLPPFDNVDVYPLVAKLAGVRPERNDGDMADLRPALATP